MEIELRFGHQQVKLEIAAKTGYLTVVEPRQTKVDPVKLALAAPMDSPLLREMVHAGQKVVVVTSDITRPCPTERLLPPVMEELATAGIPDEDVTVVFGLGSHRRHTSEEQSALMGSKMAARLRCIDSDPLQTVYIGSTTRGTPIEVFEPVVRADVRVVLGNVEPHYFAGYSGGAKAIVPGVCSVNTIRANHALMVDPRARAGNINNNPVRLDIEEGAAMVGIDFMLNVVVDSAKNILVAATGNPVTAHRWACRAMDALSMTPIDNQADIVIVSAGGYPKDINLYQAQKALDNAAVVVKPGGIIIWVAECKEGLGNKTFEQWIVGSSPDQILERIQQDFVIGGHKAAAIARVLQKASILLISELSDELVRACSMEPFRDVESALSNALQRVGPDATITVIPEGGSFLPKVK